VVELTKNHDRRQEMAKKGENMGRYNGRARDQDRKGGKGGNIVVGWQQEGATGGNKGDQQAVVCSPNTEIVLAGRAITDKGKVQ